MMIIAEKRINRFCFILKTVIYVYCLLPISKSLLLGIVAF